MQQVIRKFHLYTFDMSNAFTCNAIFGTHLAIDKILLMEYNNNFDRKCKKKCERWTQFIFVLI